MLLLLLLLLVRQPSPSLRTGELRGRGAFVRMNTYAWMDGMGYGGGKTCLRCARLLRVMPKMSDDGQSLLMKHHLTHDRISSIRYTWIPLF
jgi:hypothetical protein